MEDITALIETFTEKFAEETASPEFNAKFSKPTLSSVTPLRNGTKRVTYETKVTAACKNPLRRKFKRTILFRFLEANGEIRFTGLSYYNRKQRHVESSVAYSKSLTLKEFEDSFPRWCRCMYMDLQILKRI